MDRRPFDRKRANEEFQKRMAAAGEEDPGDGSDGGKDGPVRSANAQTADDLAGGVSQGVSDPSVTGPATSASPNLADAIDSTAGGQVTPFDGGSAAVSAGELDVFNAPQGSSSLQDIADLKSGGAWNFPGGTTTSEQSAGGITITTTWVGGYTESFISNDGTVEGWKNVHTDPTGAGPEILDSSGTELIVTDGQGKTTITETSSGPSGDATTTTVKFPDGSWVKESTDSEGDWTQESSDGTVIEMSADGTTRTGQRNADGTVTWDPPPEEESESESTTSESEESSSTEDESPSGETESSGTEDVEISPPDGETRQAPGSWDEFVASPAGQYALWRQQIREEADITPVPEGSEVYLTDAASIGEQDWVNPSDPPDGEYARALPPDVPQATMIGVDTGDIDPGPEHVPEAQDAGLDPRLFEDTSTRYGDGQREETGATAGVPTASFDQMVQDNQAAGDKNEPTTPFLGEKVASRSDEVASAMPRERLAGASQVTGGGESHEEEELESLTHGSPDTSLLEDARSLESAIPMLERVPVAGANEEEYIEKDEDVYEQPKDVDSHIDSSAAAESADVQQEEIISPNNPTELPDAVEKMGDERVDAIISPNNRGESPELVTPEIPLQVISQSFVAEPLTFATISEETQPITSEQATSASTTGSVPPDGIELTDLKTQPEIRPATEMQIERASVEPGLPGVTGPDSLHAEPAFYPVIKSAIPAEETMEADPVPNDDDDYGGG